MLRKNPDGSYTAKVGAAIEQHEAKPISCEMISKNAHASVILLDGVPHTAIPLKQCAFAQTIAREGALVREQCQAYIFLGTMCDEHLEATKVQAIRLSERAIAQERAAKRSAKPIGNLDWTDEELEDLKL